MLKTSIFIPFKGKEAGAGAVDEEDFIKAFEDVPSAQVKDQVFLDYKSLHRISRISQKNLLIKTYQ